MDRRIILAVVILGMMQASLSHAQTCQSATHKTTPTSDFTVHNNGTATHIPTGLMWKVCSEGQAWQSDGTCSGSASLYNWQAALQIPQTLNTESGYSGYTDWRLPNIKELSSLAELACVSPAINNAIFPDPSAGQLYWSASPSAQLNASTWVVDFFDGYVYDNHRNGSSLVRLVRSGQ